ncbi:MAG: T9SS type A sorting domain-containing protein [Saprospiraceae bacterium]
MRNYIVLIIFYFQFNLQAQIELVNMINVEDAEIIHSIKDDNKNIYLALEVPQSAFVIDNVVLHSSARIKPNTGIDQAVFFCVLDSNYHLKFSHQLYGVNNIDISSLSLLSDGAIYFTVSTTGDSLFIEDNLLQFTYSQTSFLLKYEPNFDSISVLKKFERVGPSDNFIIKENSDAIYISLNFRPFLRVDSLYLETTGGTSDYDNVILVLDKSMYQIIDYYYFNGSDAENIYDFVFDEAKNIIVIGDFFGSFITFLEDTISNSSIRSGDGFLFKISKTKNVIDKKRISGPGNETPLKVIIQKNGSLYILGRFEGPYIQCDKSKLNNLSSNKNIFSLFLDSNDSTINLFQLSTKNVIRSSGNLIARQSSNLIIGGTFSSDLIINGINYFKAQGNNYDAFVFLGGMDLEVGNAFQIGSEDIDHLNFVHQASEKNYLIGGGSRSSNIFFLDSIFFLKGILKSFLFDVSVKGLVNSKEIRKPKNSLLNIYPNPASNYLILNHLKQEKTNYEIVSIDGKVVNQFSSFLPDEQIIIPIYNFQPGLYKIKAENQKGIRITKTFIKQ